MPSQGQVCSIADCQEHYVVKVFKTATLQINLTSPKNGVGILLGIKSDREVELARKTGIPQKTKEDAKYCMGIWEDWCSYRRRANGDLIQPLLQLGSEDLQYWMTRFILEVR